MDFVQMEFIFDDEVSLPTKTVEIRGRKKWDKENVKNIYDRLYYQGKVKQQQRENQIQKRKEDILKKEQENMRNVPQISDVSNLIQKQKRQNNKGDHFYEYTTRWKQQVDDKNKAKKQEEDQAKKMDQLQQKQEILIQKAKSQSYNLPKDYQGPISGWHQNTEQYIQSKNVKKQAAPSFTPQIDAVSNELAKIKKLKEKTHYLRVEERLMHYQNEKENRMQQVLEQKYVQQMQEIEGAKREKWNTNTRIRIDEDDRITRLYDLNGDKEKRQKELQEFYFSQNCTFKPMLNDLTNYQEKVVQQIRRPLYEVPEKEKCKKSGINDEQGSQSVHLSKKQLDEFLIRNIQAPESKKRNIQKEYDLQKEIEYIQEYTFKPEVNANSKKIQGNIVNNNSIYHRNMVQKQKQNQWVESIHQQEKDNELQECSFKPQVNVYDPKKKNQHSKSFKDIHKDFLLNRNYQSKASNKFGNQKNNSKSKNKSVSFNFQVDEQQHARKQDPEYIDNQINMNLDEIDSMNRRGSKKTLFGTKLDDFDTIQLPPEKVDGNIFESK